MAKHSTLTAQLRNAIAIQTIQTGKLSGSVGFPGGMQGFTRQLTKKELQQQKSLAK